MRINSVCPQPQFRAVNQKYMQWAKEDYRLEKNVSTEWLDRLSFDVFIFKKISKQDAIDTIEAVKKFMGKTDAGIEENLSYFKKECQCE